MSNLINSKTERDRIKAEKERTILSFLLEEGYSTAKILAQFLKNDTQWGAKDSTEDGSQ